MKYEIGKTWQKIVLWLEKNAPEVLEEISLPATEEELDHFSSLTGLKIVDDFKYFYQIFNGISSESDTSGIFPSFDEWDEMAFGPLPLDEIAQEWNMLKELLEMGDFEGLESQSVEGIANLWWHIGWIPFADNGGGDYYCIDMAPTSTGTEGQIISHSHETGEHKIIARSLGEFLHNLANDLAEDIYTYDYDYGIRKKSSP